MNSAGNPGCLEVHGNGYEDSDNHSDKKYKDLPESCGNPGMCYLPEVYSIHKGEFCFETLITLQRCSAIPCNAPKTRVKPYIGILYD